SNMMQEHWTNYIITTPRPVFFSAHQTELSRNQTIRIDDDVKSIVLNDEFWKDVDNLLKVLNELVIGISIFESDTPCLSKVVDWYYNQLESSDKENIDGRSIDEIQTPDENVESDYEDECSSSESEEESFNDNETDDSDVQEKPAEEKPASVKKKPTEEQSVAKKAPPPVPLKPNCLK
ncbi:hypothetical protein RhiirB3_396069, partial [Rhizophagus irregularis]